MVLPPVVGGVVLLFSFGRRGLFGQYLDDWFGIRLPFTTAGVVIAQIFVALGFPPAQARSRAFLAYSHNLGEALMASQGSATQQRERARFVEALLAQGGRLAP